MPQGRADQRHWQGSVWRREAHRDRRQGAGRRAPQGAGLLQSVFRDSGGRRMRAALLAVSFLLAAGGAEELTRVEVGPLSLGVPGSWKRTTENSSTRFSAPTGEAYFLLDTGKVSTK